MEKNYNTVTKFQTLSLDEAIEKINTELKHFQKRENIQTIVKWLFFCQFLYFYLAYILRTLYNRDIKVG